MDFHWKLILDRTHQDSFLAWLFLNVGASSLLLSPMLPLISSSFYSLQTIFENKLRIIFVHGAGSKVLVSNYYL